MKARFSVFLFLFFLLPLVAFSQKGWLTIDDMPDLIKILPPPPAFGSDAFKTDKAYYDWGVEVRAKDSLRSAEAKSDAVYSLETVCRVFGPLCGIEISKNATPELYGFLDTAIATADLICKRPKKHYMRTRPFVYYSTPTLAPGDEEVLRYNGSYPSGHSVLGWTSALLLAELFPDSSDAILERGYRYGINRIVCNYHWYSDVVAGQMAAAMAVNRLHSSVDFERALKRARAETAKRVIFDNDMGSSADDLFAIQLLHRYMDEGRCRMIGVVCDRMGDSNVAMIDLLNNYYGHPDIPIGKERGYAQRPHVYIHYCAQTGDSSILGNNKNGYKRSYSDISRVPDGCALYRRLLADAPDHSVSIVAVGFMTTLSHLLNSVPDDISPLSGVDLVAKKVNTLYCMGSKFYRGCDGIPVKVGYNFDMKDGKKKRDYTFADTVFRLMPRTVKIVLSPSQVGDTVDYPIDSVLADIKEPSHPIRQIYSRFTITEGQRMWDVLPVIHCVEGETLFRLSEPGNVFIDVKNGTMVFRPSPDGNVRFQYVEGEGAEKLRRVTIDRIRASY